MARKQKNASIRMLGITLLALYMCVTLRLDVAPYEVSLSLRDAFGKMMSGALPAAVIQTAMLAVLIVYALRVKIQGAWQWFWLILPAGFLTGCMLVGRAFINPDWGNLMISLRKDQMVKWMLCLPGWFMVCLLALIVLYDLLKKAGGGYTESKAECAAASV